jgi:dipeptidyl aminopeptidase/acylaminoacyl peptidase
VRSSLVLGFAFLVLAHSVHAGASAVAPVEAFGAMPEVSDVDLSPDGTLLAWHDESAKGSRVVMFDLGTQKYRRAIPIDHGAKFRSLQWADNETLLITVSVFSNTGEAAAAWHYEFFRTFAADVAGGKDRMLLMADGARDFVTGADLLAARTTKPKTVIMSTLDYSATAGRQETGSRLAGHRKDSGWVWEVFEVDTRTGKGTKIEEGTQFTDQWLIDKSGNVVARSEWDPKEQSYTILAKKGLGWRNLLRQESHAVMQGHTADETAIILSATNDQGRAILQTLPLDGSAKQVLLEDSTYDVSDVVVDRFTRAPVSAELGGLVGSLHWFDPQAEKQYRSVAGAFPGKRVAVYGHTENNRLGLALVEGPSSPTTYYLVDFVTHKADMVGESYSGLANVTLGEVRAITYKSRDGTSIPAYLTIPPGTSGKNLPLVVLPHGGPESRDTYSFDWWVQFLAVRGYAVLQPQFRGSTGFGEAWRKAGYHQWGGLMQDDVTDGVAALVDQGIADADRICIVGASYGGYAALAGAAFTPGLFRCAVSVNGVSDLPAMITYEQLHSGKESDAAAYWRDHIGSPLDPQVAAKSPLRAAASVKIPVLIMHAADDTVVPLHQSEAMATALRTMEKNVTFIKLTGEDHWLSQAATRTQVLKEIDAFLAANLRKPP